MQNDIENDIWEYILKLAVIENSLNEIKDYPTEAEINKVVIPEQYERKMRRLITRYRNRDTSLNAIRHLKKIVAIIIILLGISFAFLLQFKEVRAACKKVIMQFYEKYIQVNYTIDLSDEEIDIEFGYIPEHFYMTEKMTNNWRISVQYENDINDTINLLFSRQMHTLQLDIEHYNIEDLQITNEIQGKLFLSLDAQFCNYIIYDDEDGYYILESSLSEDEMIEIVKNIKIVK